MNLGSLSGEITMFDLNKFLKLSSFKNASGISIMRFWDQQKLFVSSSLTGELILNGFGGKSNHNVLRIFQDDPIYDFRFLDEFNLLVCGEEPTVLQVDIRKGVLN